jgi:transposase InsO family protein
LVFTSRTYTRIVRSYGLRQEFITPHCLQQNDMIDRVIRTLKEQCVHRHRFETQQHASRVIGEWIRFYNNRRPHQTLGMKTPAMVYALAASPVQKPVGHYNRALPHPIEWLSDNGSCYRAHETISFAQSIGLVPCFTPVRSPQSKGMAESFVKTFKRDYVYVHDRPDAQSASAQLPRWFEDYNENHPHKAPRMKSPREFIRSFHQPAAACPI